MAMRRDRSVAPTHWGYPGLLCISYIHGSTVACRERPGLDLTAIALQLRLAPLDLRIVLCTAAWPRLSRG